MELSQMSQIDRSKIYPSDSEELINDLWNACLTEDDHDILFRASEVRLRLRQCHSWGERCFVGSTWEINGVYMMLFIYGLIHISIIRSNKGVVQMYTTTDINHKFFSKRNNILDVYETSMLHYIYHHDSFKSIHQDVINFLITEYQNYYMINKKILKYLGLENIWCIIRIIAEVDIKDSEISDSVYN